MSLFSFSHFLVSFFLFKKFSGLCLFLFSAVSYSLCLDPFFLKYSCVFMLRVISFMYTKSGEMWKAYRTGLSLFIVLLLLLLYMGGKFIFVAPFFFLGRHFIFFMSEGAFFYISLLCTVQLIIFTSTQPLLKKDKTSIK